MLVMASMRLRLTAYSLAGLQAPEHVRHRHQAVSHARAALTHATADLSDFYEGVAVLVGRPVAGQVLPPVKVPSLPGLNGTVSGTAADGRDSGVAVLAGSGNAAGLKEGRDLVRVITTPRHPHLLWVHEHLQHLSSHASAITGPASHVAEQRRVPWWR
jgi:hypothetical protein